MSENGGVSSEPNGGPSQPGSTLTHEEVYEILAHPRRRHVVAALHEGDSQWSLDELSRYVAEREYDVLGTGVPEETVEQVSTSLYHAHLPKLTETGVVAYDSEQRQVAATPNTRRVRTVLQAVEDVVASDD